MALGPCRCWTVISLALAVATAGSCTGNLYPLRERQIVQDGAPFPDSSGPPDSSVPAVCPDGLVGFATMSNKGGEPDSSADVMPQLDGGVSGGGSGTVVVVDATASDALTQFSAYASDKMPGPLTIVVKGMIFIPPPPDGGSGDVQKIRVSSNKTVIGADGGSGFTGGGLSMSGVSNVIIRNLVISMPNSDDASGNVDAIHIEGSHQIWVDHCDLSSNGSSADAGASFDGLVDISDASDYVTVSWTKYHDHGDTGLIGRSDSSAAAAEDAGKNHVTYDHDLFTNVRSGPRARFGVVHVLNCYFNQVTTWGVASIDGAGTRVEGSAFHEVTPPGQTDADFGPITTILDAPASAGTVDLVNNATDSTDGANVAPSTQQAPFALPYPYTPDSADSVPVLVNQCAGTGHISVPATN